MRTRNKTVPRNIPYAWNAYPADTDNDQWVFSGPGALTAGIGEPNDLSLKDERMMDELWNDDPRAYHDCKHTTVKRDHAHAGGGSSIDVVSGSGALAKYHYFIPNPATFKHVLGWEQLIVNAERLDPYFALPQLPHHITIDKDPFDTDFSIWFLLRDLQQVRHSIKQLKKHVSFFRKYGKLTAKQIHDLNLNVQYGILPTYDDIKTFVSTCINWRKAYDKLRLQQDQVYTWHSEVTNLNDIFEAHSSSKVFNQTLFSDAQVYFHRTGLNATHRRTMKYRYTCPEMTGFLARFAQFVESFGLLDPVAIWDLVPWSFVVDWFIPVGSWLHKHRFRTFWADILVLDYCESIKVEFFGVLTWVHKWGFRPSEVSTIESGATSLGFKAYSRKRFLPPIASFSQPKSVSDVCKLRRVAMAASLVAQRCPRGPRAHGRVYYWNSNGASGSVG